MGKIVSGARRAFDKVRKEVKFKFGVKSAEWKTAVGYVSEKGGSGFQLEKLGGEKGFEENQMFVEEGLSGDRPSIEHVEYKGGEDEKLERPYQRRGVRMNVNGGTCFQETTTTALRKGKLRIEDSPKSRRSNATEKPDPIGCPHHRGNNERSTIKPLGAKSKNEESTNICRTRNKDGHRRI